MPAAIRLMALLITVAAGLVDGVTEPTRPGIFNQRQALSPVAPAEINALDAHGVPRLRHVFVNLSSTRPMPVSLTASSAVLGRVFARFANNGRWQLAHRRSSACWSPFCCRTASSVKRPSHEQCWPAGCCAHFQQCRFHHLF
ncbi:hypothetical protein KCP77_09270 [Salmonella enterica subsp. enterica]|nr:hypothetical protein KCP77_09270 [Salmonella enterica subsp. enterica]